MTTRINLGPYLGYRATANLDEPDSFFCWNGKVNHIQEAVIFHASEQCHLEEAFQKAVDDYIDDCADLGLAPEAPRS